MNIYGNEVLVEQIYIKKSPIEILNYIKLRGEAQKEAAEGSEEKLKELQKRRHQKLIEHHSFYCVWLNYNSIIDYEFTSDDLFFTFKFKNLEDAMAFKLRWG